MLRAVVLALPLACCASGPGGSVVSTSAGTTVATTTSTRPSVTTATGSTVTSSGSTPTTTSTASATSTTVATRPEDAIVAYLRPGVRYIGSCDGADATTDVGAYCSRLLDDQVTTRVYAIGLTFSEFDTFLRVDQVAGGWVVGATAPIDQTTGMQSPWSTSTTTAAEVACPPFGSTSAVRSSVGDDVVFSLVGASVRAGDHDCYERVVFEMQGDGPFPSWQVDELNGPFDAVDGPTLVAGARVKVWIAATNVVTDPSTALGYRLAWSLQGSSDSRVEWPGYTALRGVVFGSGGDEKDSSSFTIGLDQLRPFRVFTLTDPPRLVVDIHAPD